MNKKVLKGHRDQITALTQSSCDKLAVSGSKDCHIRVWDLKSGKCTNIVESKGNGISGLCMLNNGSIIVSTQMDG